MRRLQLLAAFCLLASGCEGPAFTAVTSDASGGDAAVGGAGGGHPLSSSNLLGGAQGGVAGASTVAGATSTVAGGATTGGAASDVIPSSCRELPSGSPSGTYRIDPDGDGPLEPFLASCEMTNDGGGWTLILNYLHKGGTNPALTVRASSLPIVGASELGSDESTQLEQWGHASAKLVAALAPHSLWFQGKISLNDHVIDFISSDADCITYVSGGSTNCKGIAGSAVYAADHKATLPRGALSFMSGKGDSALTEFPFYDGGVAHWGVRGAGQRWEVDNTPVTGSASDTYDTLHRVWAR